MQHIRILFLCLALLAALCAPVLAAEFSPTLDDQLAKSGDQEFVSAIVILPSAVDIRALDDQLHNSHASLAERHKTVIEALKYNAELTQPAFREELDKAMLDKAVIGYTAYWIENLFVVQATKEYLESLRGRGDVEYVSENFHAELMDPIQSDVRHPAPSPLDNLTLPPGIAAVGAYRVNTELGITGQGVLVGVCDTGVNGAHAALSARWRGNFAPWYHCWKDDLGTGTTTPNDGYGHGTHVMGTMTGRAISGNDTIWIGCAPNARWIATNAINQGVGGGFDNDIISDYQWFAVPDVIQNSWGVNTGLGYATCFSFWNTAILNCEAAGPVITWSAGNEGPGASTLRSPAIYSINSRQIFAVGAVDATNFNAPYPIASFSSRGPTQCTPAVPDNIKPEISAPGVDVYSSLAGQLGGPYGNLSGTSMAGPHIAGVVALMREACPDCDYITIKDALMATAIDYGTAGQDNTYGWGFVDGYNAVLAVMGNLGRVMGTVRDAATLTPLQANVQVVGGSQSVTASPSGAYSLMLPGDSTYTLRFSLYGYATLNAPVTIISGDTVFQDANLVANRGRVQGTVRDANTLSPLQALVQVVGGSEQMTAGANGAYSFFLLGDSSYTLRFSLYGYITQDLPVTIISGDTVNQDANLAPRPIITVLSEGFESGAPGWTHESAGGSWIDQWHISTERANTGTSSYKCGDTGTGTYGAFNDARLISPVVNNLPAESHLKFYMQIESELSGAYPDSAYDGAILEISANGGAFTRVAPIGGYPKTFRILRGGGNPTTGPMPGQPCWAGNFLTWTQREVDLSVYAGQNVQLRFRFGSDQATGLEGMYVDDVTITAFGTVVVEQPQALVISVSGNDLILRWGDDQNPAYLIFSDTTPDGTFPTLEGSTTDTIFTIPGGVLADPKRFYRVVGWDGN